MGHAFQQWTIPLRFELDYAFYQRTRFSIKTRDSGVDYNNRLSIVSQPVLLNMYYDYDINPDWSVFGGPGGGLSHTRVRVIKTNLNNPADIHWFNNQNNLEWAWALSAGIARDVGERSVISLMYRYLDNGRVSSGPNQSDSHEFFSGRLKRNDIIVAFDYYY